MLSYEDQNWNSRDRSPTGRPSLALLCSTSVETPSLVGVPSCSCIADPRCWDPRLPPSYCESLAFFLSLSLSLSLSACMVGVCARRVPIFYWLGARLRPPRWTLTSQNKVNVRAGIQYGKDEKHPNVRTRNCVQNSGND